MQRKQQFTNIEVKIHSLIEDAMMGCLMLVCLLIIVLPLCLGMGTVMIDVLFNTSLGALIEPLIKEGMFLGTIIMLPPMIITTLYIKYISWSLINQRKYFHQTEEYYENINEILDKLEKMKRTTSIIIKFLNFLRYIIKEKDYILIRNYLDNEMGFFIPFIQNLRSDLSIRLAEQQSALESAKSEVEKNITGTTELNQVSELQRARLDRQIEQFEELQRVLVKV